MFKTKTILILTALILWVTVISCEKQNYDDSVFWKITNPKTNISSYILGTVHSMDTTFIHFPKNDLKKIIEGADVLSTEVDPTQFNEIEIDLPPIYTSEDKYKISNTLDKEYYDKLMRIVDSSRYALYQWQPYLDSVAPTKIVELLNYDRQYMRSHFFLENNYSPEADFINHAKTKAIEFMPLETPQEWESYYSYYSGKNKSYEENLNVLKETIDIYYDESYIDIFKQYSEQNLNFKNKEMFSDSIMILRNKRMSTRIDSILKHKKVFIAVGAAHLPFENGILNLLSKKGYVIERKHIELQK